MSTTNRAWPDVAIPPGETLAEEIEARGMSQSELARQMSRPVQAINEIINGVKAITADTALQLEEVLGIPGDFWVRLDADYRYNRARLAKTKRAIVSASAAMGRLAVQRTIHRKKSRDSKAAGPKARAKGREVSASAAKRAMAGRSGSR